MSETNAIATLQGISFLRDIDPVHLQLIATISGIHVYDLNDVLFYEGQPAEYVYLVVSGAIVLKLSPAGIHQKALLTFGPGEMLGWSSFLEQRKYGSTGLVAAPTRLVKIDGRQLRALCDREPEFGYDFMCRTMRTVAHRLTTSWRQLATLCVPGSFPTLANANE